MGKYSFFASSQPRNAVVLGGVSVSWDTRVLTASYLGDTVSIDTLNPGDAAIISRSNARVSIVKCQLPADPARFFVWCCGFFRGRIYGRDEYEFEREHAEYSMEISLAHGAVRMLFGPDTDHAGRAFRLACYADSFAGITARDVLFGIHSVLPYVPRAWLLDGLIKRGMQFTAEQIFALTGEVAS